MRSIIMNFLNLNLFLIFVVMNVDYIIREIKLSYLIGSERSTEVEWLLNYFKDLIHNKKEELIKEHELMTGDIWSKYSCDCLGFYVSALHRKIVELGGWL